MGRWVGMLKSGTGRVHGITTFVVISSLGLGLVYAFGLRIHHGVIARNNVPWQTTFDSEHSPGLEPWNLHETYQNPSEVSFLDGRLEFHVKTETDDEWAYLYLDPKSYRWTNMSWELTIRRETAFQEFALNFRYQDFDNRYRYRFEDGWIYFDKKVAGRWSNGIGSVPFQMAEGVWYDVRIETQGRDSQCYVDGVLRMRNHDRDLKGGSVAIILWEIDQSTDLIAGVGPMTIREIAQEEDELATGSTGSDHGVGRDVESGAMWHGRAFG